MYTKFVPNVYEVVIECILRLYLMYIKVIPNVY